MIIKMPTKRKQDFRFRNEIDNGTDPDLKVFARATLPKIVDHLDRALKLAGEKTAAK